MLFQNVILLYNEEHSFQISHIYITNMILGGKNLPYQTLNYRQKNTQLPFFHGIIKLFKEMHSFLRGQQGEGMGPEQDQWD